ncbi:hypothetical protein, conserved in T. vivax, partial [Trypanosoma vivax Y486]
MALYGSSRSQFWFISFVGGWSRQLEEFLQEAGQLSAEEQLPVLQGLQLPLLPSLSQALARQEVRRRLLALHLQRVVLSFPSRLAALRLQVHCEALLEHALRWAVRAPERSLWERCRRCRAVLHLPLHCRSVLVMRARVPNKLAPLLSRATAPAAHMVSSPFPFSVATHPATLPRPLRVHVPASCRLQWSTSLALRPSLCPHLLSLWLRARLRAQWLVAARALRPHMPQQPSIAALLAENGARCCHGPFRHVRACRVYVRGCFALVSGEPRPALEDAT